MCVCVCACTKVAGSYHLLISDDNRRHRFGGGKEQEFDFYMLNLKSLPNKQVDILSRQLDISICSRGKKSRPEM